jgi:hypothetical protein
MHRVRGELLRGFDDTTAERCFQDAIGIARKQSAKFWELRAAISLARLWSEQGKHDAARNLLGPTYEWFTEGFDTPVACYVDLIASELTDLAGKANDIVARRKIEPTRRPGG